MNAEVLHSSEEDDIAPSHNLFADRIPEFVNLFRIHLVTNEVETI
jgi:hypothetical protein